MNAYDLISDSYSMELLVVLFLERVWMRVQTYLKERDQRAEDLEEVKLKQENEDKQNVQLNKIEAGLAGIEAKQTFFEEYLKNQMK